MFSDRTLTEKGVPPRSCSASNPKRQRETEREREREREREANLCGKTNDVFKTKQKSSVAIGEKLPRRKKKVV